MEMTDGCSLSRCSKGAVPSDTEVQADVTERSRPAVTGRLLVNISQH